MTDFSEFYGAEPAITTSAPGRVNLIGEHTDYNGGFVLPTAIPQRTRVELTPNSSRRARVYSGNIPNSFKEFQIGAEIKQHKWTDYIQGVCKIVREALGDGAILGFDARVESTVPMGSGLSSSAALEVSFFKALRKAFKLPLTDIEIAKLCQKVENEFVGARVGIMDPMACALADQGTALFLDTRSMETRKVHLPDGVELIVINSGVSHSNVGGDYNTRRAECEKACAELKIHELRDLGIQDLPRLQNLPQVLLKRVRHVITENQRVLDAVNIIETDEAGAGEKLGKLFYESHQSMRDDYAVSIPEIDTLVEIAMQDADVYGARLTGGGFGGSIVCLAKIGKATEASRRIVAEYNGKTGRRGTILVP